MTEPEFEADLRRALREVADAVPVVDADAGPNRRDGVDLVGSKPLDPEPSAQDRSQRIARAPWLLAIGVVAAGVVFLVGLTVTRSSDGPAEDIQAGPAPTVRSATDSEALDAAVSAPTADVVSNPDGESPAPPPRWSTVPLGETFPDGGVVTARSSDGTVVVISAGGPEGFAAWVGDGSAFTQAVVEGTSRGELTWVSEVASVDGGFLAAFGNHETFVPQLWFSADGTSWTALDTVGLDAPADVHSIVPTADGVMMTGSLRVGQRPSQGPFEPAVWASTDLREWTRQGIDADRGDFVGGLAETGRGFVAVGRRRGVPTQWRRVDDVWQVDEETNLHDLGVGGSVDVLVSSGPVLVGVGTRDDDSLLVVTSGDGGLSWTLAPPRSFLDRGGAWEVAWAAGAFWVLAHEFTRGWDDVDGCYVDIELCRDGSRPVLLRSSDGVAWSRLDPSSLTDTGVALWGVIPGGSELALRVGDRSEGLAISTLASGAALPEVVNPRPVAAPEIPLVESGDPLPVASTARRVVSLHCGIAHLGELDGSNWRLAPEWESFEDYGGADGWPSHWPLANGNVYGYVTRTAEDTIEYWLDGGEVIGVYHPTDPDDRFICY